MKGRRGRRESKEATPPATIMLLCCSFSVVIGEEVVVVREAGLLFFWRAALQYVIILLMSCTQFSFLSPVCYRLSHYIPHRVDEYLQSINSLVSAKLSGTRILHFEAIAISTTQLGDFDTASATLKSPGGGFHRRADHQTLLRHASRPWSHEITRICCGSISVHFRQPMATLAGPGVATTRDLMTDACLAATVKSQTTWEQQKKRHQATARPVWPPRSNEKQKTSWTSFRVAFFWGRSQVRGI